MKDNEGQWSLRRENKVSPKRVTAYHLETVSRWPGLEAEFSSHPGLRRWEVEPREAKEATRQSTREERDVQRQITGDVQKVPLEASAEYWSLHIYMRFPKTRDKKHQKGLGEALELTEDQKVPAILARRKTLSFVALEIDYSRVLPQ